MTPMLPNETSRWKDEPLVNALICRVDGAEVGPVASGDLKCVVVSFS